MLIGLVSKVFSDDKVVEEALKLAEIISLRPKMAVQMAKESINQCNTNLYQI